MMVMISVFFSFVGWLKQSLPLRARRLTPRHTPMPIPIFAPVDRTCGITGCRLIGWCWSGQGKGYSATEVLKLEVAVVAVAEGVVVVVVVIEEEDREILFAVNKLY